MKRNRRGSSLTEILIAGGLMAVGLIPLFGYWVKLARDTGSVTSRARTFRAVRESLDRHAAMGAGRLMELAAADGTLVDPAADARAMVAPPRSRYTAALRLEGRSTSWAGAAVAAVAGSRTNAVTARLVRSGDLMRLTVNSEEFPALKMERLFELPVEPAAPAWIER